MPGSSKSDYKPDRRGTTEFGLGVPDQDLLALRNLRDLLDQSDLAMLLRDARRSVGSPFSGRTIPDRGQLQLAPAVHAGNPGLAQPEHPNFHLAVDAVEQTRALAERGGSRFRVLLCQPRLDGQPPPATAPFAARVGATGLPYLDLAPEFRARVREGERLFFEVDGHPNAAGYRLFAEMVLVHLRSTAQASNLAGLRGRLLPRADPSHLPSNGN